MTTTTGRQLGGYGPWSQKLVLDEEAVSEEVRPALIKDVAVAVALALMFGALALVAL